MDCLFSQNNTFRGTRDQQIISRWPKGVQQIDLTNARILKALPSRWPPSCKTINLSWCENLTALPDAWPEGIEEIDLSNCKGLKALPSTWPPSCKKVNLNDCSALAVLPEAWPKGIEEIYINRCRTLTKLPPIWPPSCKKVTLMWCENLTVLPNAWPEDIEKIDLRGGILADLPATWPPNCKKITFSGAIHPTVLPDAWPEGIEEIEFIGCRSLKALPATWPPNCKKINFSGAINLTVLPNAWPEGIEYIDFSGCKSLTALPATWPPNCKTIALAVCENLTVLPDAWPEGVENINLKECTSLVWTPKMQTQFQTLESFGCEILYPAHFLVDQAYLLKAQMDKVIEQYRHDYPQNTNPAQLETVLTRLLQESIGERGGINAVLSSLKPVVDSLTASPEHIRWANEIAAWSLQGCVNQPQLGWSKISAWIQIAQADSLANKIDAARYLLALDIIAEEVSNMRVGRSVEVEAANVLLVQAHLRLIEEGFLSTPWLGVSAGVAYAALISKDCSTERTNRITDAIEALSSQEIIERLTKTEHARIWGAVACPIIVQEIEEKYAPIKTDYREIYAIKSGYDTLEAIMDEMNTDSLKIGEDKALIKQKLERLLKKFSNATAVDFLKEIENLDIEADRELIEAITLFTRHPGLMKKHEYHHDFAMIKEIVDNIERKKEEMALIFYDSPSQEIPFSQKKSLLSPEETESNIAKSSNKHRPSDR